MHMPQSQCIPDSLKSLLCRCRYVCVCTCVDVSVVYASALLLQLTSYTALWFLYTAPVVDIADGCGQSNKMHLELLQRRLR